ncbi:MAG TPA: hypothetical protein VE688_06990 [Gaiellaceae bacterium]|nr:hypothetical protein [Gaiellaceae bacterium]
MATSQTTTSTTYTDLTTAGPAATVTIPASGNALVIVTSSETNSGSSGGAFMSYAVSGATTVAAADARAFSFVNGGNQAQTVQGSATFYVTGLTAGSNTFTAKYRATVGTATFANRSITVIPLS